MTHLVSRRWTISLLLLGPLIMSSACMSLTGNTPTETQSSEGTVKPLTATPLLDATSVSPIETQTLSAEPEEILVEGDLVFGPGAFNLLDPTAGLSGLLSYKATLRLTFDGTEVGQPSQWSKTYAMLVTSTPTTRQLTIEATGQVSDSEPVFMAEFAGTAYTQRGENVCNATVIDPENLLAQQMEPAGFLIGVIGAEDASNDTINGLAVSHYLFDERALGLLDIAKSTGEIWIASDGDYVVKYILTTTGDADYFGEGIEGTVTWDYELTDVNQAIALELPKDCPAGMIDAPLLPDATDVQNMPGLLSYTTASSAIEVAAFYQHRLPTLGWQPTADPSISATAALMEFTQDNQLLSVIITAGEAGTTVHILAEVQP